MKVINIISRSAYDLLKNNQAACIIDVRTEKECSEYGIPELNNEIYCIPWRSGLDMQINSSFEQELESILKNFENKPELFFICKTGGRSFEAADLISKKWPSNCYNIVDGFEGSAWGAGWKQNNLPWQMVA